MCTAHSASLNNVVMLLVILNAQGWGWLRVRPPGELIHDKLFGQECLKMGMLPSCSAVVLVAAGAVIGTLQHTGSARAGASCGPVMHMCRYI